VVLLIYIYEGQAFCIAWRLTVADSLDLCRLTHGLVRFELALGVEEVGCKDGVDEGGLAEASLALLCVMTPIEGIRHQSLRLSRWLPAPTTHDHDQVELETAFEEFVLCEGEREVAVRIPDSIASSTL